jgi:hypothetical protein
MQKTKLNEKEQKKGYEIARCFYCNQDLQQPYWEPRYNGFKGKCNRCEVTWNLS